MSRLATGLWIAFGVTVIGLTLLVVLIAGTFPFLDKGQLYGAFPFIAIPAAIGGPILGVLAMKSSIRTVGTYPAGIACGYFVGAVGGYYCARYGTGIRGLFAFPAVLIVPFLGAFAATFIRKRRTGAIP